jgi:hypothetical protein
MKKMVFRQILQAKCPREKRTIRKNDTFSHVPLRKKGNNFLKGIKFPLEVTSVEEKWTKFIRRTIFSQREND